MNDNKQLTWEEAVIWLRNQVDKNYLVNACYYDDPVNLAAERYTGSEEWNAIRKIVGFKFPCSVLDIGAGRGISSYAFAKDGCAVTAIEPDPSRIVGAGSIQQLVDATKTPICIVGDYGETLPFENESFDIVYGRAVLHHAKDLRAFCKEVARVAKKGGYVLFTREHVISAKEDLDIFLKSHALHFLYGGENAYLLSEYKNALLSGGLKIRKIYSPLSTPINFAPLSIANLNEIIKNKFTSKFRVNGLASKWLFKLLKSTYVIYRSILDDSPGRLYSFLASK